MASAVSGACAQTQEHSDAELIGAIYDAAPIGLCVLDRDLRFVRINQLLADHNGVSVADHIGRTIYEVLPQMAPAVEPRLRRVLAGESLYGIEVSGETPLRPGVVRTWRENWVPLRDAAGTVVGISVSAEEITREKAALASLHDSEQRLGLAQEAAGIGAWEYRLDDATTIWSPEMFRIYGLPQGGPAVPSSLWRQYVAPEDFDRSTFPPGADGYRVGQSFACEFRIVRPDGAARNVLARARVMGEGDRPERIVGVNIDVTELRVTEAALLRSQERLRVTQEAAGIGYWEAMIDADGRQQMSWSKEIYALYGRDPALGPPQTEEWASYVHPEDLDHALTPSYDADGRFSKDFRVRDAQGGWRWLTARGQMVEGGPGGFTRILGVNIDVTAVHQAEEAARESEERLRFGLKAARMVAWDYDVATESSRRSGEAGELFGIRLAGDAQEIFDLIVPEDLPRVRSAWTEALTGAGALDLEYRLRLPDGRVLWVADCAQCLRDSDGRPTRVVGVIRDITAQVEASQQLARSEDRFRTMAEALPAMLWVTDRGGTNVYVNDAFRAFTGRTDSGLLNGRWLETMHRDDVDTAKAAWARASASGEAYGMECRFRRHDGQWRWHMVRALPIRDDDGIIDRWVGTCTDIHERREAEAELQRRVDEAVAARATALQQLHEAQKLESIGQLTGGVAHDFNNLLTPIVGSLDLIRRRIDDERLQRLADGALASAERARTLIQRLLAFARRQTLQPRAVNPATLAEGMRELVQRSLGPAIQFELDVPADLPAALVDPNQLELALLNLSLNARDAMPEGGRLGWTAAVETIDDGRLGLAPGDYLRFSVHDTGEGMDAATLARAVEPFFSTKPAGKGTGLGLSMVHGVAAQSGGAFRLDSAPGQGTTAQLWLPVATVCAIEGGAREADTRTAERPAMLLLIDDEEEVRLTTAESLTELGYAVTAVASAEAALAQLAAGLVPDLVVTDHMMPDMTGAQLAAAARQRLPNLPVLLITGYANLRPEETIGLDVLPKPFRFAELAVRVADLLAGDVRRAG